MNLHDTIHGFTVTRIVPVPELDATLYQMTHDGTGLELCWLDRAEENKTFGIAFQTLPWDDTGVFHILEHSVLCGSDRYPVKEPFVELMKGSMNTFLNAMTFPDKTFYPISSRNDQDFLNLTRVYLDAVFRPAIVRKPEIFHQEGWHYAFPPEGGPEYKGVVFNEMKGAFADPDELMELHLNQLLFPESPYRFVSGGDPAHIPDLTYEQFVESHRTFYSPSNAYVWLDGAVNLDQVLSILDGEYLRGCPRKQRPAPPPMQQPVNGGLRQACYEIGPEEAPEGKARLAFGWVIGDYSQRERLIAFQVLAQALCGNNRAPLCKALLPLAEEVTFRVMDGVAQPWVKIELKHLKAEDMGRAEELLSATLRQLAEEGLDRQLLEACMDNLEFQLRERDFGSYPQGLLFGIQALESWLYGGRPEANLEVGDLFTRLRAKMAEGSFERLIRDQLLDNGHRCQVALLPSPAAGEERRAREAQRLQAETAAWTPEEEGAHRRQEEVLLAWQNSQDTPEQLATLPHLERKDLPQLPEELPTRQEAYSGLSVLLHPVNCGGIVYLNLYFDITGKDRASLPVLSLLCRLLGNLPTRRSSVEELNRQIQRLCGSLDFTISAYGRENDSRSYTTQLRVSLSVLEQKLAPALDLVLEILRETQVDQEDLVREVLRQVKARRFQRILTSGHGVALGRVAAQSFASGAVEEAANGVDFYLWLKAQEENWDWPGLQALLQEELAGTFGRANLTLSVTCLKEGPAKMAAERLSAGLPEGRPGGAPTLSPTGRCREGLLIPADVSFTARGGDLNAWGAGYSGSWELAARMIGLAYLWNVIRVQGGAYGAGAAVRDSGLFCCWSYRDPSGGRSLEQYLGCAQALEELCSPGADLTTYLIGTISDLSPLLTPRQKGLSGDGLYWKGTSWDTRCQRRRALLDTTPEDLLACAKAIQPVLEQGGLSILGGQKQLDQAGPLDRVISL